MPEIQMVVALLVCGFLFGRSTPVVAQQVDFYETLEIERDVQTDPARVIAGSIASAYVGAFTGAGIGFLIDRGTGCGARNCEWDGSTGLEIGALAGTVIAPVSSHTG